MNDRALFPFGCLLAVSLLGVLALPSARLSLAYDATLIARGAVGVLVLVLAVSAANFFWQRMIKDPWTVSMATIACAAAFPIAVAADPRVLYALVGLAALGLYLIVRGQYAASKTEFALGALVVGLALLLFPYPNSTSTTGAFQIMALDGPLRSMDWIYHRTLIASILRYGVASTGLDGLVPDAYHVGGHYFLAGIMRIVGAGPDSSPIALNLPSTYLLNLFSLVLLATAYLRQTKLANPVVGMLFVATVWVVLAWFAKMSGMSPYVEILSSGVAMPLAGAMVVTAFLTITHELERPWPTMVAMLALLAIVSMTKISSALICYSLVGAAYGLHWLRTPKDPPRLAIACAWAVLGGLILYLAYRYVAVLAAFTPPSSSILGRIVKYQFFVYKCVGMAAISFILWAAFFRIRETLDKRAAISLALLHLVGLAACVVVVTATSVVTNDGDTAYFWISLNHMLMFGSAFALSMIAVRMLPLITARPALVSAIAACCVVTGAYTAYSAQRDQWQLSVKFICRTLGQNRCAPLQGADSTEIVAAMASKSQVARIASRINSSNRDSTVVVIDKSTGFFKAMDKLSGFARRDGCYMRGWNLFTLTGVPLKFGVGYGDPADGLCKGHSPSDGINWVRYGYGVYQNAGPRPIDDSTINDACRTTDSRAIFVVGPKYSVARKACPPQRSN